MDRNSKIIIKGLTNIIVILIGLITGVISGSIIGLYYGVKIGLITCLSILVCVSFGLVVYHIYQECFVDNTTEFTIIEQHEFTEV